MKHAITLFILLCLTLPRSVTAQQFGIQVPLDGTETFRQITDKTEKYLASLPDSDEKSRFSKHFTRWAWYMSMHLGPAGEFVNVSKRTFDAAMAQGDAPLTSANGSWSFVGPSNAFNMNPSADLLGNGRVDRMAFHPTDPDIIYVGTPSGGLWRTFTGGTTWTGVSSFVPSLGISGIVIDHSDPNTCYILTGDGDTYLPSYVNSSGYHRLSVGVLVSHNGCGTWEPTGPMSTNEFCGYRLIQHPTNASILLAATSDGIWRTTDACATWTRVATGRYYDLAFKPGSPSTVYASGQGRFAYSTNTGASFNTNSTFDVALCSTGRVEIAVTPNASNRVYLFAGPATNSETRFCGFYLSTNSGTSFTRLTNAPNILGNENGNSGDQSEYDMGVAVKPTDYNKVMTCGLVVYKSTDGGNTFSNVTTYRESGGNYIHPDCHDIAYNPLNNYLYCATDGGFYRSTNDGTSWTPLFAGINTAQFYHFDDYDADANILLGGCQDNGIKYRNTASSSFAHILCCDGFDAAIDYTSGISAYVSMNGSVLYYSNLVFVSPDDVASSAQAFAQVELNSSNPDILYYCYYRPVKYVRSTNTYTTLGPSTVNGGWVVRTCPSNSNRLYMAGGTSAFDDFGDLSMSSDGGATWSTISGNTGFPATFPRISDIGVRPTNSGQVYACFSGYTDGLKVLYSSNTGTSWTNISYDLPNIPVWSIQVDANNNVYVGGDIGVYYLANGATTWEPYYNGIPNVPISGLAINETADQLLASTFGRGIWKSALRAPCPANVTISNYLSGQYFSSASNTITMNGVVFGGTGTSVALRAGNSVVLTEGFQANSDPGNEFRAYLGPCGSGMPPAFAPQPVGVIYPAELNQYSMEVTRHDGTLEVTTDGTGHRQVVLRQFQPGPVRILLATSGGQFIRNIAEFNGEKETTSYDLGGSELAPGLYYLYLVVNGKVMHLQEMNI